MDFSRMPSEASRDEHRVGEQRMFLPTISATVVAQPHEVPDICDPVALGTGRHIERSNLTLHIRADMFAGLAELPWLDVLELPFHHPTSHRVRVPAKNRETKAARLEEG